MMYESQQAQAPMTLHQPPPVRKGLRRNASLYHAVIQREGPNQFTVDTLRHLHETQVLHHSAVTAKSSQVAFPAQLAAPKPTDGDQASKIRRSQSVRAVLKKSASFLLGKTRSSQQTAPVQPNLEATTSNYLPVALTVPRGATLVSPLSSLAAAEPKVWSNSLHRPVSKKASNQTSSAKRWKSLISLRYQPSAPTLQGPIYETIDDAYYADQMVPTNRPVGVYKSQSHVSLMPVPLPTAPSSSSSAVSSPRAIGYMGPTTGGSWSIPRPRNPLVDLSPAEEDEDTSSSSPVPSVVIPASRFLQGTVDDVNEDLSENDVVFYPNGYQSLPLHPTCSHQVHQPPVYFHDWKPPTPPPMIHCGCRRCHLMAKKNMQEQQTQSHCRHQPHLRRHVSFQLKEMSPAVTTTAVGSTAVGAKSNANGNKKESTGQPYLHPRNGPAAILNAKSPGPNHPRRSLSKPGHDRREVEPNSPGNSEDSSGSSPNGVGSNSSTSSSSGTGSAPRTPMTSAEALSLYGSRLTAYERLELEHYPEVWYLGLEARKIHGEPGGPQNGGYDDENGSYHKVLHDHLAFRYEILEVIGKGSFGQVIRALDHKSGQQVAIKIIRNKKRFHHQALVEIRILDHLRRRDKDGSNHVIHMLDYFYFRSHLCITFELLSLNLYEVLKKQGYQGFNLGLIRRLGRSLLECLRLLKQENIIHCDLKPENVLVQARGSASIKVIDFGSSCYSHQRVYTYIQSRFYRSPEVILGLPYGPPIDMWSFGCILCEMYTGYPLFPGENEMEQLACIMECLGLPSENVVANATRRRLFFDSRGQPRCITNTKGRKRRPGSKDLASILKCNDAAFVNLVSRCLEWDPAKRLTPEEALRHEWFTSSMQSSPNTPSVSSPRLSDQDASQASKEKDRERDKDKLKNFQMYQVYKAKKTTGSNKATGSLFPDDQSIPEPPNLDDSGTFLPTIL